MKYIKTVRADSKGRVTGATPGEEYKIHNDGQGGFYMTPKEPYVYEAEREVSYEQFVAFFGCTPGEMSVDGLQVVEKAHKLQHYPSAIAFQRFRTDENGNRQYMGAGKRMSGAGSAIKDDVIIRVCKPES